MKSGAQCFPKEAKQGSAGAPHLMLLMLLMLRSASPCFPKEAKQGRDSERRPSFRDQGK